MKTILAAYLMFCIKVFFLYFEVVEISLKCFLIRITTVITAVKWLIIDFSRTSILIWGQWPGNDGIKSIEIYLTAR